MHSKPRSAATLAAVFSASILAAGAAIAVETDELPASFVSNMKPHTTRGASRSDGNGTAGGRFSNHTLGVDSIPNFSGYFYEPGISLSGSGAGFPQFTWPYTMVGKAPSKDENSTTVIGAPIVPVIIDLRNFDGSPRYYPGPNGPVRMILDPSAKVQTVLNSPSFTPASYGSGAPAQFTDALFRAQFKGLAAPDWHTVLKPQVKLPRTMVLIRGTYRFSVDATGHLRYVLVDDSVFNNALFPPGPGDTTTVMGQAETAGDVTTKDISTFLFQDTYLYSNGDPGNCCILGFHSYDLEPGDAYNNWRERRYVMNFSSYISPGIFGTFQDVTAISHELSETFDDPFVGNFTPIWLAPNNNCQNNLETGDVVEGLPNAIFTVASRGFTYHMQNEALLEWFVGAPARPSLSGAYSWPDSTVLLAPAKSLLPDCSTPVPF